MRESLDYNPINMEHQYNIDIETIYILKATLVGASVPDDQERHVYAEHNVEVANFVTTSLYHACNWYFLTNNVIKDLSCEGNGKFNGTNP